MSRTRRIRLLVRRSSSAEVVGVNMQASDVGEFDGDEVTDAASAETTRFPCVAAVRSGSAAARVGLRPRDRICQIHDTVVHHLGEQIDAVVQIIRNLSVADFYVEVLRGKGPVYDRGIGSTTWKAEQQRQRKHQHQHQQPKQLDEEAGPHGRGMQLPWSTTPVECVGAEKALPNVESSQFPAINGVLDSNEQTTALSPIVNSDDGNFTASGAMRVARAHESNENNEYQCGNGGSDPHEYVDLLEIRVHDGDHSKDDDDDRRRTEAKKGEKRTVPSLLKRTWPGDTRPSEPPPLRKSAAKFPPSPLDRLTRAGLTFARSQHGPTCASFSIPGHSSTGEKGSGRVIVGKGPLFDDASSWAPIGCYRASDTEVLLYSCLVLLALRGHPALMESFWSDVERAVEEANHKDEWLSSEGVLADNDNDPDDKVKGGSKCSHNGSAAESPPSPSSPLSSSSSPAGSLPKEHTNAQRSRREIRRQRRQRERVIAASHLSSTMKPETRCSAVREDEWNFEGRRRVVMTTQVHEVTAFALRERPKTATQQRIAAAGLNEPPRCGMRMASATLVEDRVGSMEEGAIVSASTARRLSEKKDLKYARRTWLLGATGGWDDVNPSHGHAAPAEALEVASELLAPLTSAPLSATTTTTEVAHIELSSFSSSFFSSISSAPVTATDTRSDSNAQRGAWRRASSQSLQAVRTLGTCELRVVSAAMALWPGRGRINTVGRNRRRGDRCGEPPPPAVLRAYLALHSQGLINGPVLRPSTSARQSEKAMDAATAQASSEETSEHSSQQRSTTLSPRRIEFQRRAVSALPRVADLLGTHGHTLWRLLCDCDVAHAGTEGEGSRDYDNNADYHGQEAIDVGKGAGTAEDGSTEVIMEGAKAVVVERGTGTANVLYTPPRISSNDAPCMQQKHPLIGLVRLGRYVCHRPMTGVPAETPASVAAALYVPVGEVLRLNAWRFSSQHESRRGRHASSSSTGHFRATSRFTVNARVNFQPATRPLFFLGRFAQQFAAMHLPRGALGHIDNMVGHDSSTKRSRKTVHNTCNRPSPTSLPPLPRSSPQSALERMDLVNAAAGSPLSFLTAPWKHGGAANAMSLTAYLKQPVPRDQLDLAVAQCKQLDQQAGLTAAPLERRLPWQLEDLLLLQGAVILHRHSSRGQRSSSASSHHLYGMAAFSSLPMQLPQAAMRRRAAQLGRWEHEQDGAALIATGNGTAKYGRKHKRNGSDICGHSRARGAEGGAPKERTVVQNCGKGGSTADRDWEKLLANHSTAFLKCKLCTSSAKSCQCMNGRTRVVVRVDATGKVLEEYCSCAAVVERVNAAADFEGIMLGHSELSVHLKGVKLSCKGLLFRYKDERFNRKSRMRDMATPSANLLVCESEDMIIGYPVEELDTMDTDLTFIARVTTETASTTAAAAAAFSDLQTYNISVTANADAAAPLTTQRITIEPQEQDRNPNPNPNHLQQQIIEQQQTLKVANQEVFAVPKEVLSPSPERIVRTFSSALLTAREYSISYEEVYTACNQGGAAVNGKFFRWQPIEESAVAAGVLRVKGRPPGLNNYLPRSLDHKKAVVLLDAKDNIIRVYQSQQYAAKKLFISNSSVSLCVNGKQRASHGFRLRNKSEVDAGTVRVVPSEFDHPDAGRDEWGEAETIPPQHIGRPPGKMSKKSGNMIARLLRKPSWDKKGSTRDIAAVSETEYGKHLKQMVVLLDAEDKVLRTYQSQQVAACALRISRTAVSLCVNGKQRATYGFRLRKKSEVDVGNIRIVPMEFDHPDIGRDQWTTTEMQFKKVESPSDLEKQSSTGEHLIHEGEVCNGNGHTAEMRGRVVDKTWRTDLKRGDQSLALVMIYHSQKEASQNLRINPSLVSMCVTGKVPTAHGHLLCNHSADTAALDFMPELIDELAGEPNTSIKGSLKQPETEPMQSTVEEKRGATNRIAAPLGFELLVAGSECSSAERFEDDALRVSKITSDVRVEAVGSVAAKTKVLAEEDPQIESCSLLPPPRPSSSFTSSVSLSESSRVKHSSTTGELVANTSKPKLLKVSNASDNNQRDSSMQSCAAAFSVTYTAGRKNITASEYIDEAPPSSKPTVNGGSDDVNGDTGGDCGADGHSINDAEVGEVMRESFLKRRRLNVGPPSVCTKWSVFTAQTFQDMRYKLKCPSSKHNDFYGDGGDAEEEDTLRSIWLEDRVLPPKRNLMGADSAGGLGRHCGAGISRTSLGRDPPHHNLLSLDRSTIIANKRKRAMGRIKALVCRFQASLSLAKEDEQIEIIDTKLRRDKCSNGDGGSDPQYRPFAESSDLGWLVDAAKGGHARSQELLSYIALTTVAKASSGSPPPPPPPPPPPYSSSSSSSSSSLQPMGGGLDEAKDPCLLQENLDEEEYKEMPLLSSMPSVTFVTSGMARVWAACEGGGIPITRKPIFRHPSPCGGGSCGDVNHDIAATMLPIGTTFSFDAIMVQVVSHEGCKIAVTFYHISASSSKKMSSVSLASSSAPSEYPVGWVHNFSFAFPGLLSVTPDLDIEGSDALTYVAWESIARTTEELAGRFSPDACRAAWSRLWSKPTKSGDAALVPRVSSHTLGLFPPSSTIEESSLPVVSPLALLAPFSAYETEVAVQRKAIDQNHLRRTMRKVARGLIAAERRRWWRSSRASEAQAAAKCAARGVNGSAIQHVGLSRMETETWKPYACPLKSCSKRYVQARCCALHPKLRCINAARVGAAVVATAVAEAKALYYNPTDYCDMCGGDQHEPLLMFCENAWTPNDAEEERQRPGGRDFASGEKPEGRCFGSAHSYCTGFIGVPKCDWFCGACLRKEPSWVEVIDKRGRARAKIKFLVSAFQADLSLAKEKEQMEAMEEDKWGFGVGICGGDCDGDDAGVPAALKYIARDVAIDVFWQQEARDDRGSVEAWEEEFRQIQEEEAADTDTDANEEEAQGTKRSKKERHC